jgi:hypothetical protein
VGWCLTSELRATGHSQHGSVPLGRSWSLLLKPTRAPLIPKQIKRLMSIMFDATLWLAVSSAWCRGTTNQNNPRTELQ